MADGMMDIAPDAEVKDFSYNSKMYSASKLSAILGGFLGAEDVQARSSYYAPQRTWKAVEDTAVKTYDGNLFMPDGSVFALSSLELDVDSNVSSVQLSAVPQYNVDGKGHYTYIGLAYTTDPQPFYFQTADGTTLELGFNVTGDGTYSVVVGDPAAGVAVAQQPQGEPVPECDLEFDYGGSRCKVKATNMYAKASDLNTFVREFLGVPDDGSIVPTLLQLMEVSASKADISALDGYLPLSGGQMSGNIDMGGDYGLNEDSYFLKFIDRYLGNGIMGAGFGVYKADGDGGLETQYVLEGVQLSDDGSEHDVMRRMDIVPLAGRLSEAEDRLEGKRDYADLSYVRKITPETYKWLLAVPGVQQDVELLPYENKVQWASGESEGDYVILKQPGQQVWTLQVLRDGRGVDIAALVETAEGEAEIDFGGGYVARLDRSEWEVDDMFALRSELSACAEQISDKADLSALGGYYAKSETSSAAEISSALDQKRSALYNSLSALDNSPLSSFDGASTDPAVLTEVLLAVKNALSAMRDALKMNMS